MRSSYLFEFLRELALGSRNSFSCLIIDNRIDMHDLIWVLLLFSLSTVNTGQPTPDVLKKHLKSIYYNICIPHACEFLLCFRGFEERWAGCMKENVI